MPSLQRGAVWKPNQIELLWDSILRGFPIGSLVVCDLLKTQNTRKGIHSESNPETGTCKEKKRNYTHHLLDGQQRANAIALGYLDPFRVEEQGAPLDPDTLLWLDLTPSPERFHSTSTRTYLLRVTTTAHPWGFRIGEEKEPKKLQAGDARDAIEAFQAWAGSTSNSAKRSRPVNGCPWDADAPIPLAWALEASKGLKDTETESARSVIQALRDRCEEFITTRNLYEKPGTKTHWAIHARSKLDEWLARDPASSRPHCKELITALFRVQHARIVALPVPHDALTQPSHWEQEHETVQNAEERIANVEHLFQRLNSGGTELRGDDLAYSMIKAYWPGIEHAIQEIKIRPPETQVALLGARLALGGQNQELPPGINISQLRSISLVHQQEEKAENWSASGKRNDERLIRKKNIEYMFGLGHEASTEAPRISKALGKLDEWFLYKKESCDWGLPPVLRSRLADQAPEVFLFLLHPADHAAQNSAATCNDEVRKKLLGLATALHWFGLDRQRAVRWLWKLATPDEWLNGTTFDKEKYLLSKLSERPDDDSEWEHHRTIARILNPKDLDEVYFAKEFFQKESIEHWGWRKNLVPSASRINPKTKIQETPDQYWDRYGEFIKMLSNQNYTGLNSLLLMYAQRTQMAHYFGDYDPSRIGYWDAHNVPWDFDHILPQSEFYNLKGANTFLEVCKQRGGTIGNLHLWPFEKNRSRQDGSFSKEKIEQDELERMLLWDDNNEQGEKDRRGKFSLTKEQIKNDEKNGEINPANRKQVHAFVLETRSRLIRIYTSWFDALEIKNLISEP